MAPIAIPSPQHWARCHQNPEPLWAGNWWHEGARVFQIEAERPIKQTHGTGQHKGRDIAPTNAPEPAPIKVFTSPGFEL